MKKVMEEKLNIALAAFHEQVNEMDHPIVLELGTKRSDPARSTMHKDFVPHASRFMGFDLEAGEDVDIVGDIHRLSHFVGREKMDIIISCSTFEHLKYPFLAAHEIMRSLKIGGLLYIQTHQTFPLHAYPFDYFRYSTEALAGLFGTRMGFEVQKVAYEFPATIHSKRVPDIEKFNAYLNVVLTGKKLHKTPNRYQYEFDHA
jgi:hypothetical protein